MKVLMTSDCVGGVWTYALDLARELTRTGHDVILAVMGRALADDQREALDAAGLHAWDARPYALEWMPEAEDGLAAAGPWLAGLAEEHAPDVVHLNQFDVGVSQWPCPAVVVAHSDVVTWWRAVHGTDPPPAWDAYRERVAAGLAAADLVVAPTAAMLDDLRAAYDVPTPATVVPNGRSLALPDAPKQPQIAAVARVWDEAKNVGAAVRAAQDLAWPLVVAGEDAAGEAADGRRSPADVAALLAASSIFVAPARYEPFGLAALEAGVAGCALVLGDIPSLREVWGDAATFVDPDDEPALRSALQSLIDNPQLLRERQAAAAARATGFDVASMAAAYVELYRQVCAPRGERDRVAS